MGFHRDAEALTTAAFRALIARVTEPALGELEALRVALDVRSEALTAALTGPTCIDPTWLHGVIDQLAHAAGEEAEAAARAARGQALEEVQGRWECERAEAEKRLELVRAEVAAEREADRLEHAALTEALEQASAQVDAIRAHAATQLEATSAAQTQRLEETHAQLEAAHVEAERAVAARLGEIADLRAQLEVARAEVQQAHAETDRVEQAAQARLERARAEFEAQKESEAATRAALTEALEEARTQLDVARTRATEHIAAAEAAQAEALARAYAERDAACAKVQTAIRAARLEAAAQLEVAGWEARAARATQPTMARPDGANAPDELLGRVSTAFRTIDEAASLTRVLDALLDCAGAVFPRAALFVVTAEQLQGWRSIGFEGVTAITRQFELPLTTDSVLTRAVTTGRAIVTGDGRAPNAERAGAEGGEPWTVTLPVAMGSRVVAVVYADEGDRTGNSAPSRDRRTALKVSDMLVRHAGRRLAALTATPRMAGGDPAPEAPIEPEAGDASTERARHEEPQRLEDAKRYAHLLVSEIKRYQQANILGGLPDCSLSERLKGEIERCRSLYARRVPPDAGATFNCFDEALFEMLGGGDVDVRGPFEQTAGAPPTSTTLDRPAVAALPVSVRT